MSDCPFCKVDPARCFYEGPLVLGLWDAFPVNPGHALLVPRRHVASWFDATPEEHAELLTAIARARAAILERFPADGFNLGVNVGEAAGQTVFHLHVHLIPRRKGDVPDPRGGVRYVVPGRANYLAAQSSVDLLSTGGDRPLLPALARDLARAQRADVAVAFVMWSGIERLWPHLVDLVDRGGRLRLLTGDYLDITDPTALRRLLDLAATHPSAVELRVFAEAGTSFHPKAYLLIDAPGQGVAYVGSSNLSKSALEDGVEWNYRVLTSRDGLGFQQVAEAFEALFQDRRTRAIDAAWVEDYESRRTQRPPTAMLDAQAEPLPPPPEPNTLQRLALEALQQTRAEGQTAGLVVLATGLGKTWLAAFDTNRPQFRRVLFVAHREEILTQAMATFRRIRPTARLGLYDGEHKDEQADVLFASIQTLGRRLHLDRFDPRHFDYVVVDEFHHASAATYRRLIDHFEPRFLLGLTATPERTDGGDLLQLCQENLVFRRDVVDGVKAGLLCPFRYFGVPDDVDYANIPWRSTRFDEEALTSAVATQRRAENALEQWRKHGCARTLGFCVSQRHALFMRDFFRERGVKAAAVFSGPGSDLRAESLEALGAGRLQVLFAVDMFNEGVDVPSVDSVMMLRPTESQILWLQQFGRGLRKHGEKVLTVIDYIGNHRIFLLKARTLLQVPPGDDRALDAALKQVLEHEFELPPGCEVTYELKAVEMMRELLRLPRGDEALKLYYEDFRERNGARPLAAEAFHDGYKPRSARTHYRSWLGFVESQGDLAREQLAALREFEGFFHALEVTQMTKSFKMLVVLAMLNTDTLPGAGIGIDALVKEFRRLAGRNPRLEGEVGAELRDDRAVRRLLEKNPIAAWVEGRGTGDTPWFEFTREGVFRFVGKVPEEAREAFQALTRELADWRLAEYLSREEYQASPGRFVAKVSHSGGRPILFLPDRRKAQGVPTGWQKVRIDGEDYEANFVKVALNVVRKPGSSQNELPAILRGWFGHDAGMPGTDHLVACEPEGEGYVISRAREIAEPTLEVGRAYPREQIPQFFGEKFSDAMWNVGMVICPKEHPKYVIVLATLEKSGMAEAHKYDDRFLSSSVFQWVTQNRTTRESKHGKIIREHEKLGVEIHVFVRKTKKVAGGSAAPFEYFGKARFARWEGDGPGVVRLELGRYTS